jgi:hypothetical protein
MLVISWMDGELNMGMVDVIAFANGAGMDHSP